MYYLVLRMSGRDDLREAVMGIIDTYEPLRVEVYGDTFPAPSPLRSATAPSPIRYSPMRSSVRSSPAPSPTVDRRVMEDEAVEQSMAASDRYEAHDYDASHELFSKAARTFRRAGNERCALEQEAMGAQALAMKTWWHHQRDVSAAHSRDASWLFGRINDVGRGMEMDLRAAETAAREAYEEEDWERCHAYHDEAVRIRALIGHDSREAVGHVEHDWLEARIRDRSRCEVPDQANEET